MKLNLDTNRENEVRELTADELTAVSGGMRAVMALGNVAIVVSADATQHNVTIITCK